MLIFKFKKLFVIIKRNVFIHIPIQREYHWVLWKVMEIKPEHKWGKNIVPKFGKVPLLFDQN